MQVWSFISISFLTLRFLRRLEINASPACPGHSHEVEAVQPDVGCGRQPVTAWGPRSSGVAGRLAAGDGRPVAAVRAVGPGDPVQRVDGLGGEAGLGAGPLAAGAARERQPPGAGRRARRRRGGAGRRRRF